jgi:hypothetical protein
LDVNLEVEVIFFFDVDGGCMEVEVNMKPVKLEMAVEQ